VRLAEPVRLAAAVVGVGALFLPWLTVQAYGPTALVGWGVHLVAGLLLVLALAPHADPAGGLAALARTALPPPASAAIRWYYVIGVTVGQAVVATVGGALVAGAVRRPAVAFPSAVTILAVATVLVMLGRAGPAWSAHLAFAAVVVCVALRVRPAGIDVPHDGGWPRAAAVVVFAFVGWEATLRLHRPHPLAVTAAVALVGLVYLGGALLATSDLPAPPRVVDGIAAAVCVSACVRNLAAVTSLASGTRPRRRSVRVALTAAAGTAAVGCVALVAAHRVGLFDLLSVPAAMGLAVFLTAATAAARLGRGAYRTAAVAAALCYAAVLPFAGIAAAAPILVFSVCVLIHLLGGNHAVDHPRLVRRVPGGRLRSSGDQLQPDRAAAAVDAAGDHPRGAAGTAVVRPVRRTGDSHDRLAHPGAG
jgi:hypothetical protein